MLQLTYLLRGFQRLLVSTSLRKSRRKVAPRLCIVRLRLDSSLQQLDRLRILKVLYKSNRKPEIKVRSMLRHVDCVST